MSIVDQMGQSILAKAKKQRENQIVIKEMQFRLGIDQHDFDTKCKSILKFLDKNNNMISGLSQIINDSSNNIIEGISNKLVKELIDKLSNKRTIH